MQFSLPGLNRQVALFLIYSAVYHIGLFGITDVLLNFYFVSLGHSPEVIGMLQSLSRISGLLTGLPVGLVANRIGARRIILYSTIGTAGIYVLLVFYPSLIGLALSRFLLGFLYGAGQIATSPLMVTLTEKRYITHLFAYHNVVGMAATAVGSFAGGYLPGIMARILPGQGVLQAQSSLTYGAALGIAGIIILVSVIPLRWLSDSRIALESRGRLFPARIPWMQLSILSLPLLIFGFSGGLTFPFYNLFFRTTFHVPDETVGMILSVGWLGMGLFPLTNPWWERRFGRALALGITLTIAAAAFFFLSIPSTLILSVIVFTVAVSTRNTMQPLYQPLVLDNLPPELHNLVSSFSMVLWNVGWFVATAVSGHWQTRYGFGFIMQVVAAAVLVNAVMIVMIFRKRAFSSVGAV